MNHQEYEKKAISAAEAGDWDSAIKYAKYVPTNWNIWERFPTTGNLNSENLNKLLNNVPKSAMPSFLFEMSSNLHPDIDPGTLERMANLGLDDHYVQKNIKSHPNWKPSKDTVNDQIAAQFWRSYERRTNPSHFAAVKSLFTQKPESIVDHRGRRGDTETSHVSDGFVYDHNDIAAVHDRDIANEQDIEKAKKIQHIEPTKDFFHMKHAIAALPDHAKKVQAAIMKDETIPKRYFGNKPYIKLYRGVGGGYAKAIRDSVQYNPETGEASHKKLKVPTAHLTSWTTSRDQAIRFASTRGDHDNMPGQGVVMSAWHPVDSILHSGFHTVTPEQEHAHPQEEEIIIGHPDGHTKTSTKSFEFQAQSPHTGPQNEEIYNYSKARVRKD